MFKIIALLPVVLGLIACSEGQEVNNALNYKRLAYSCSGFVNSKAYHIDIYEAYGGSHKTYETDQNNVTRLGYMGSEVSLDKDLLLYINNESLYLNVNRDCQKY